MQQETSRQVILFIALMELGVSQTQSVQVTFFNQDSIHPRVNMHTFKTTPVGVTNQIPNHFYSRQQYQQHRQQYSITDSITRLVNEQVYVIMLMQEGTQANQFANVIDRAGNITNFVGNRRGKSFFFSQDSKETRYLIFVSAIRKGISGKHPTCVHFFFDLY